MSDGGFEAEQGLDELLSDLLRVPAQGDLDPLHGAVQVHDEREGAAFRSLEQQSGALASNDPLHDLGGLEPRIHFGGDAAKQAATLQRPDEGAEIREGRSVAVCQTKRRCCGNYAVAPRDCRVATRKRFGFGWLADQQAGRLGLASLLAWRRFPMPPAVERDESRRCQRPVTGEHQVSASGLGVILEGEQDVSPLPRREAPECPCPSPERESAR